MLQKRVEEYDKKKYLNLKIALNSEGIPYTLYMNWKNKLAKEGDYNVSIDRYKKSQDISKLIVDGRYVTKRDLLKSYNKTPKDFSAWLKGEDSKKTISDYIHYLEQEPTIHYNGRSYSKIKDLLQVLGYTMTQYNNWVKVSGKTFYTDYGVEEFIRYRRKIDG